MMTGYTAARGMPLAAVALAAAVGLCLTTGLEPGAVRAAQKEKAVSPSAHVDPACDYLKGSAPTFETAGKLSTGIAACRACHSDAGMGQAKGFVDSYKSNEFVRLNESTTWDEQDIHAMAMRCLTDPLGKQMEAILKKHRPEGYTVAKAPECLVCHSADLAPHKPLAAKKYEDFATAPGGVTCTLCHGMHQTWQIAHFEEPTMAGQPMPWRAKPPAEKFSKGMHDLRNPVVKAALCASCHVGNAAEGKVVTHEIYAAGHPPLPPFTLAAYMEGEPRHWGYATELPYFKEVNAAQSWKTFHFHPAKEEVYLARHFAVGAIASLRAEAELILADAERAAKEGDVLDFARFDCYACHHELRSPSERQKRGYGDNAPGRTPIRAAAGVPAGVVAKHAETIEAGGLKGAAGGFDAKWAAIRKAATARPLGDAKKLLTEAKGMKEWCDTFLKVQSETATPIYTVGETTRLRGMLKETAVSLSATADPEAAMCLAWSVRSLTENGKSETPGDDKLGAVVPLNVRTAPFSEMSGKRTLPVMAKFPERMKKVAVFEAPKFVDAFNAAFPKK